MLPSKISAKELISIPDKFYEILSLERRPNAREVCAYMSDCLLKPKNSEYPVSVYSELYSKDDNKDEEYQLRNMADEVITEFFYKHNLIAIQEKNLFMFTNTIYPENVGLMVRYGFPNDCYPILCFLNRLGLSFYTAFDIGANRGNVTIFLAKRSKTVHSFEASQTTSAQAKRNLEINNIKNCIFNTVGVGEKSDNLIFYEKKYSGHSSFLNTFDEPVLSSPQTQVISLDDYCKENDISYIDFIKIDVEGYEPYVIKGMKDILKNKKCDMIIFEIGQSYISKSSEMTKEMLEQLSNSGFVFFDLHMECRSIDDILNTYICEDYVAIIEHKAGSLLEKWRETYQPRHHREA